MNNEHIQQLEERFLELSKDEALSSRDNKKLEILSVHLCKLYKLREEKEKEQAKINASNEKFSMFMKELHKSDAINRIVDGIIRFVADPAACYQQPTINDKE